MHAKIALFHLSVWLIGQGGWKFCSGPGFDSLHFAAQAEVALGRKLQILQIIFLT